MLLTSLHVWLTFGKDRQSHNSVEIGKFPLEKVQFQSELVYPKENEGYTVKTQLSLETA